MSEDFLKNPMSIFAVWEGGMSFHGGLIGVLAAPGLVLLMASGFASDPVAMSLSVSMTRIMFPYILFMSLVALHIAAALWHLARRDGLFQRMWR